jgi:hypothetical protein
MTGILVTPLVKYDPEKHDSRVQEIQNFEKAVDESMDFWAKIAIKRKENETAPEQPVPSSYVKNPNISKT